MNQQTYEPIIGLEIHVELKTLSKMFCGCSADYFGHEPNTHCCPVCLGLPGALPVPNRKAIEWCVMLGLALGCEIPHFSKFDRKNYFYPDLPKGYQISQYDKPFAINGNLSVSFPRRRESDPRLREDDIEQRTIRIRRVHMEEDTGKLIHAKVDGKDCTLIDFNRSGVPLVEIVTEPDIRSSEEARIFLKKLHQIIRYLGISDANMEKGSMRLEPNISVRRKLQSDKDTSGVESELPNYKVEVKNINSFNFAKKAIDYEVKRHIELLEQGVTPTQETRGWDEKKGVTYSQRSKEEAHDYRYFPEPDIPPIRWTGDHISKIKDQIVELPDQKMKRFMKEYGLSEYDANVLTDELDVANYFEEAVSEGKSLPAKTIANWIINKKMDSASVSAKELVSKIAHSGQKSAMGGGELKKIVQKVVAGNEKAVSDYKAGKKQSLMFLIGQVMRLTKGKADVSFVKQHIEQILRNK